MYYVSRNGVQQGPHSIEQINTLLAAGQLSGNDLAWQEGMANWESLSRIPGVHALGGPPPMPGGPPATLGAYLPPQSYIGGHMGQPQAPPRSSGMAIASLVMGILTLIFFLAHVFAIILGLLAVIFGHIARGTINRSRGEITGGGMAMAGLVTGYIGMVLAAIWLILIVIFAKELSDPDSELRREIRKNHPELERIIEQSENEQREKLNQNP
jgi:hypothetical protein